MIWMQDFIQSRIGMFERWLYRGSSDFLPKSQLYGGRFGNFRFFTAKYFSATPGLS